jgi:hypothetical protein
MPEKEPQYFKEFRKHVDTRFDTVENKIENEIGELAAMTMRQFHFMEEKMATKEDIREIWSVMVTKDDIKGMATKDDIKDMATKSDIRDLDAHIGRYERRLQPMEEIVLKDHRVRSRALEKEVGI